MYFPYLYSRQAELNAVSDLAKFLGSPQIIFPLIEPVEPAGKLISTLGNLKAEQNAAYVVINPHQGKLSTSTAQTSWLSDFAATLSDTSLVHPTFKENPGSSATDVAAFVKSYPSRPIGVLLTTSRIAPSDLSAALGSSDYTVFFTTSANAAVYSGAVAANRSVDVSDNFRPEARNKDYAGEEWLANNHSSWSSAGRKGFSDFTMLPGTFKDGGGPVGAVAIHLTYEDGTDLYVQHFVSPTNNQTDPQATKFREVLDQIYAQQLATPTRFRDSPGLKSYEDQRKTGNYTNLSGNKRQQVSHHIYTVGKYLGI